MSARPCSRRPCVILPIQPLKCRWRNAPCLSHGSPTVLCIAAKWFLGVTFSSVRNYIAPQLRAHRPSNVDRIQVSAVLNSTCIYTGPPESYSDKGRVRSLPRMRSPVGVFLPKVRPHWQHESYGNESTLYNAKEMGGGEAGRGVAGTGPFSWSRAPSASTRAPGPSWSTNMSPRLFTSGLHAASFVSQTTIW